MINISFRDINDQDLDMVEAWFKKEHVSKWYGNTAEWMGKIKLRNTLYSWLKHLIVMEGEKPIGFCQYADCYLSDDKDSFDAHEPGDTYAIEYLIGDENYLGKGYGKAIVKLLTEYLRDTVGARRIIAMPDSDNHASNTILRGNGYLYDDYMEYYCIEF